MAKGYEASVSTLNAAAAPMQLAARLPAAVLADLLDLRPNTAVRWVGRAGGDWTGYAAEIARAGHHQP